jgi:hypothetical protein
MFKISLDKEQIIKIVKSALIAGLGACAVYALENLAGLNFGIYQPLVVAGSSWLINVIKVALKY